MNAAALLALMEKHGLGTSATQSRIVEILLISSYVARKKGRWSHDMEDVAPCRAAGPPVIGTHGPVGCVIRGHYREAGLRARLHGRHPHVYAGTGVCRMLHDEG